MHCHHAFIPLGRGREAAFTDHACLTDRPMLLSKIKATPKNDLVSN